VSPLDQVLSDLPPGVRPRVERTPEHDDGDRIAVTLWGSIGGWGVFLPLRGRDPDRLTSVADQVQDWAVEELWSRGEAAVWPECPTHPDSHPLRPAGGAWHCPKTGERVAAIGQLLG